MTIASFLEVKVIARAKKGGLVGLEGTRLKVKVHSPREKGKANEELIRLLADFLKIPPSHISIVKGGVATIKLLHIQGIEEKELFKKLQGLNAELPLM